MTCPICQKTTDKAYRPFCSKRCADVDLGRWLTEGYAVPDETSPHQEDQDAIEERDRRLH